MDETREKLTQIQSLWRRRFIAFIIDALLLSQAMRWLQRGGNWHWVGRPCRRLLHPLTKWGLLTIVLLLGLFVLHDLHAILFWIAGWGLVLSIYTIVASILFIISSDSFKRQAGRND